MSEQIALQILLMNIGITLLRVQQAEAALKVCIWWVEANPEETIEGLESRREAMRKRTLGFFVSRLRVKLEISPEFESALSRFLDARNRFAHDLQSVPGFSVTTKEGLDAGIEFLMELRKTAEHVLAVIMGFDQLFANAKDKDREILSMPPTTEQIQQVMALLNLKFK